MTDDAARRPKTKAKAKPNPKPKPKAQVAALPWRLEADGVEILLITSRETARWVIPKGWPMKGKTPAAAAAAEARQEAGVVGDIERRAVGAYPYVKFARTGLGRPCKVKVFPLKVTTQRDDWREKAQRTTQWFPAPEAAAAVQERALARLIRRFAKRAGKGTVKNRSRLPSPLAGEGVGEADG